MTLPKPYYHDEQYGITIYHGDCRDILPHLEPVDLVLTDPPYGINWKSPISTVDWEYVTNDGELMDLSFMLNMPCKVVSFGANCYPSQLPHRGRWICWDKRVDPKADAMLGSPFELAWTNKTSGFDKIYRIMHGGVVNADRGKRYHPTQKPISLFRSILQDYHDSRTILDPFMGSGTTLVAAKQLGRKAIGIEIEKKYCDIAIERPRQGVLEL
jgi:site-specific DNA-methyltransferase (adenine-specific)/modification methylase